MANKTLPFSAKQLSEIIKKYPTPVHIYDEKGIVENAKALNQAFAWAPGFKEFYAVKAAPNPFLLKILKNQNFGTDCSSLAELILSNRSGISGEEIMFTSNDTQAKEFQVAREFGAVINLDDITHIPFLEEHAGLPDLICFRYNPGPLREGNVIIGKPEEAKYGLTKPQLFEAYKICKEKGVKRFGLHTMVASNELDVKYFGETIQMLLDLVIELNSQLGITFEFINMGGGIGIPYRPEQNAVDYLELSKIIKNVYEKTLQGTNLPPIKLFMECGRAITGPYGYLVSTVLHKKEIYKNYIGLDACMANLMRPAMYGSYHHITVVGKEGEKTDHIYDVTGSLCENNDKFAIDRELPKTVPGDIVVIHDAGAHGHAMGFNYNGKTRSAELLLRQNGEVQEIRRAETLDDHFGTLDFDKLEKFSC
jgi:diaminopimelate decarboxylase